MDHQIQQKLTVVVPTFNRYLFLTRLLKYYLFRGSPFQMHILDSGSNTAGQNEVKRLISSNLVYTQYPPTIHPFTKLTQALQNVSTPYVVIWADDDLMVPSAFNAGVRFLEEQPDFSIVHGQSAQFVIQPDGGVDIGPYLQRSYPSSTAAARLVDYLSNYSVTFYSVHRTEALAKNLELTQRHGFGYYWGEIALGCLSAIQGRVGQLDDLYMMKEAHAGMGDWPDRDSGNGLFDWVTGAAFSGKYHDFEECLAIELARKDGIVEDDAREVVREAFWSHLAQGLTKKWQAKYAPNNAGLRYNSRRVAQRYPVFRRLWHRSRSYLPGKSKQMSLPALLRPASPYHRDFMPIYESIITSNSNATRNLRPPNLAASVTNNSE